MADYLIKGETLSDIADAIRTKKNTNKSMTAGEFAEEIQSIEADSGITLPTLTNEGTAADLLANKQLLDDDGNIVTGTIETKTSDDVSSSGPNVYIPAGYFSSQVTKNVGIGSVPSPTITIDSAGKIIATTPVTQGYVTGGNITNTKQLAFQAAQTITPGTTNKTIAANTYLGGVQTIEGDANLVAANIVSGKSIFGVVGTATTGGGGNADAEDGLVTRNLTSYTNDRVTIIGSYAFYSCSKLTTANFPACTSIGSNTFNGCSSLRTVSFPACTSIGSSAFIGCSSLRTVSFPVCTSIGSYAFYSCSKLTTANFPACTSIGGSAFYYCSSLTTVSFPVCTSIGSYAFYYCLKLTTVSFPACTSIGGSAFIGCSKLTTVSFPVCTSIGGSAFYNCSKLATVSFPVCTTIGSYAFQKCYNLTTLYLTGSTICTLSNSNAFTSTPIGGYSASAGIFGTIYVPRSLLTSYKTATNWTYFSSRFSAIEDFI